MLNVVRMKADCLCSSLNHLNLLEKHPLWWLMIHWVPFQLQPVIRHLTPKQLLAQYGLYCNKPSTSLDNFNHKCKISFGVNFDPIKIQSMHILFHPFNLPLILGMRHCDTHVYNPILSQPSMKFYFNDHHYKTIFSLKTYTLE